MLEDTKVVRELKFWIHATCLSPSGVKLGGSKDYYLLKYYNVQKRESSFTLRLATAKNISGQRCTLNSVQKSQWVHSYIPPPPKPGSSKDCYLLKYYNVQKWESSFTLGLDIAKNTHYIQKSFK